MTFVFVSSEPDLTPGKLAWGLRGTSRLWDNGLCSSHFPYQSLPAGMAVGGDGRLIIPVPEQEGRGQERRGQVQL
jgi:hypothetical protein